MRLAQLLLASAAVTDSEAFASDSVQEVVVDVPAERGALNRAVDDVAAGKHPAARTQLRLAPGRHELTSPLVLTPAHSGLSVVGTFSSSSSTDPSVISGGVQLDPSVWKTFGPAECAGCEAIVFAPIPNGAKDFRQFYVNGERANWTSAMFPTAGAAITATGYAYTYL
jgi:hypothetical protein